MNEKSLNNLFLEVQQNAACHQKFLKVLENLYSKTPFELFVDQFMHKIKVVFEKDITDRNPYIERFLDFCAQFVALITKVTQREETQNDDEPSHPFLTRIIKETLLYHKLIYVEARYHSCKFITLILKHIGYETQLDNNICDMIQDAMLERILDPKYQIRIQAVTALVRLQEPLNPDCPVVKAYISGFYDINPMVRREVVGRVAPNAVTIVKIKERVQDVDASVRMAALQRCADIGPKLFKIVDRQSILISGFSESVKNVRTIFMENLLSKWLSNYGGDFLKFLSGLKLDADEEDINNTVILSKQVMEVFFRKHSIHEIIKALPVGKEKLIPVNELTSDNVMYWCILSNYLRQLEDEGEMYLELILPEFTHFCNYIQSFINLKTSKAMDEWENLDYQFILNNLFEMADQYDMSDEVGRRTFQKLVVDLMQKYKFQSKIVFKLVSVVNKLTSNPKMFTDYMCSIISDIREPLVDEESSQEKQREKEFMMAQLKVQIHILQGDKEEALDKQDYSRVGEIVKDLAQVTSKLDTLKGVVECEKVRVVRDDPDTVCQCLDLLIGMLEQPTVTKLSPALNTIYTEFVLPLLTSNLPEVNWRVLKCLSLYSDIDVKIARDNAKIICIPIATYRAIPNFNKPALLVSVGAVSDLIRLYGVSIFGSDENSSNSSQIQTNRRKLYRNEDMDDVSVIDHNRMNVEFLIEIILDMLDDENEDIRDMALTSLAKLIMDNFPVNPLLISRMILKWYNPVTGNSDGGSSSRPTKQRKQENEKQDVIQQKLGLVIVKYAKTIKGAREVVEKAVIPILTSIANAPKTSPLADIDVDNMLKFLAIITNTSGTTDIVNIHTNLAHSLFNKMASKPHDTCSAYMAKMLNYLEIPADNSAPIKELIRQGELILEDLVDKNPHKNVKKFIEILKAQAEACEQTQAEELSSVRETTEIDATAATVDEGGETETQQKDKLDDENANNKSAELTIDNEDKENNSVEEARKNIVEGNSSEQGIKRKHEVDNTPSKKLKIDARVCQRERPVKAVEKLKSNHKPSLIERKSSRINGTLVTVANAEIPLRLGHSPNAKENTTRQEKVDKNKAISLIVGDKTQVSTRRSQSASSSNSENIPKLNSGKKSKEVQTVKNAKDKRSISQSSLESSKSVDSRRSLQEKEDLPTKKSKESVRKSKGKRYNTSSSRSRKDSASSEEKSSKSKNKAESNKRSRMDTKKYYEKSKFKEHISRSRSQSTTATSVSSKLTKINNQQKAIESKRNKSLNLTSTSSSQNSQESVITRKSFSSLNISVNLRTRTKSALSKSSMSSSVSSTSRKSAGRLSFPSPTSSSRLRKKSLLANSSTSSIRKSEGKFGKATSNSKKSVKAAMKSPVSSQASSTTSAVFKSSSSDGNLERPSRNSFTRSQSSSTPLKSIIGFSEDSSTGKLLKSARLAAKSSDTSKSASKSTRSKSVNKSKNDSSDSTAVKINKAISSTKSLNKNKKSDSSESTPVKTNPPKSSIKSSNKNKRAGSSESSPLKIKAAKSNTKSSNKNTDSSDASPVKRSTRSGRPSSLSSSLSTPARSVDRAPNRTPARKLITSTSSDSTQSSVRTSARTKVLSVALKRSKRNTPNKNMLNRLREDVNNLSKISEKSREGRSTSSKESPVVERTKRQRNSLVKRQSIPNGQVKRKKQRGRISISTDSEYNSYDNDDMTIRTPSSNSSRNKSTKRPKVIHTDTSSDELVSPSRKSIRKIKRKNMDDFV